MKHSTSSTQMKTNAKKRSNLTKTSPYLNVDFGGIPIDTNTLAGQWMTFSHMANHYRKLLNVKPRVDSGLVQGNGIQNNFTTSSAVMMQSSKPQKKMGSSNKRQTLSSNNNSSNNNFQLYQQQNQKNGLLFSSHPDHLNTPRKAKEVTSKSTLKSSSKHNTSCQLQPQPQFSDYQVVFGPSSIRSSTDAFLSDETDSTMSNDNKPPSEVQAPIGVTEKIRRFLSHIHQLDLPSPSSVKKKGRPKTVTAPQPPATAILTSNGVKVTGKRASSSVAVTTPSSTSNNIDFRLSRHSKCFLPWEPTQSPRKSPKLSSKSGLRSSGEKLLSSSISSLNKRQGRSKLGVESRKSSNCDQLYYQSSGLGRNRHTGSGMDIHSMMPEKDGSGKKPGKSRRRAESIASIGTICGSEELTAEDYLPMSIKDICSTLESGIMGDDDINDLLFSRTMDDNLYLRKHKKSSPNNRHHYHDLSYTPSHGALPMGSTLLKSNSMASLVPTPSRGGCGDSTINNSRTKGDSGVGSSVQANGNNKDSSRDSAYGFSSGESRITTRESTPEKKCLGEKSHKHHRSHRDIDLQEKPCKDRFDKVAPSLSSEKRFSSKAFKDHRHLRSSRKDDSPTGLNAKTNAVQSLRRQDSSETYITLLTELTQDIVSQGIYTNKGLKTVFKSYIDQHKNLNQDKLADMLERLRMDLGIPKDDALDRIEFGYGSISNKPSTTFFYKPPSPDEKLSTESITGMNPPTHPPSTESLQSDSPSPTTIIPTTIIPEALLTPAPTTTTGFSSSPNTSSNRSTTTTEEGSGDMASDNDNYKNHEEDIGVVREDDDDELSLSETEVTQALKFAGLDDGEMEELVGILNS